MLQEQLAKTVLSDGEFRKLTFVPRHNVRFTRLSLRPVQIKDTLYWQREIIVKKQAKVKNLDQDGVRQVLDSIMAHRGALDLHLLSTTKEQHIRVTKKGKVRISEGQPQNVSEPPQLQHDRVKQHPLGQFDAKALLRVIGIMDAQGKIKASRRGKYDQINALLQIIDSMTRRTPTRKLNIVDCGCGLAYLTLATWYYLTMALGFEVTIWGIDKEEELVKKAERMANALDISSRVHFIQGDINSVVLPETPDMLLSLHACDTATDEALARGMEWGCRYILSVPCCQHELHKSIRTNGPMRSVMQHGILKQRQADILTDALRAQILRILGYRVSVMEFVSPEASARNILLKAESGAKPGQPAALCEYHDLCEFWQVKPWLHNRLLPMLTPYLAE